MVKILSIEPYRRESSLAQVELSSGEVYNIGFEGLQPVLNKGQYSDALERFLNSFEKGNFPDLFGYLCYQMSCEKLEIPTYASPDYNGDRVRIGQRIRELRMASKMEAKTLATRSQIDPANVTRIEQGKYSVGLDILCRIAMVLDSKVELIPRHSSPKKKYQFSLDRKLFVIPTGAGVRFDPISTIPPSGFSLWPATFDDKYHIGDLVVFYLTDEQRYSYPFVVSTPHIRLDDIAEIHTQYSNAWPVSESGDYLMVRNIELAREDKIHIEELIKKSIKKAPTKVIEIQL